jgi:hypothetical protein
VRRALLFFSLFLSACGGPALAPTEVRLALDFSANALLELFVVPESEQRCADLLAGAAPAVEAFSRPARALNDGGSVTFELDELPAEVALTFYARAVEAGALLSHDCRGGVVIPAGGEVEVRLVVREAE